MQDFIQKLKQKPEPVRRRIAVGTSVGITALVGIIWLSAMSASGAFALGPSGAKNTQTAQAPSADAFALSGTNQKSNLSQLAGAVESATGATTSQPSLTIIDGDAPSSGDQPAQAKAPNNNNTAATVIPF